MSEPKLKRFCPFFKLLT